MCGLAGYNISLDEAIKLGEEGVEKITEAGWLFNLHRGTHAHGWCATYDGQHPYPNQKGNKKYSLWHYKAPGLPYYSLDEKNVPQGTPINLMMHTRDYTKGTPANNENNHPLSAGGHVWVTHNGGIDNHHAIKNTYGEKGVTYPEVDSVALPILLEGIKDPFNEDEVKKGIDHLATTVNAASAYTFHAMWDNAPGLSLLAMGKDRPLLIAYHEERSILLYSSEKDALAEMMKIFKLEEDENLVLGELNDGKAIMVHYGKPLFHHTFKPNKGYKNQSQLDANLGRYLPSSDDLIMDNSGYSHYTQFGAPYSSRLFNESQKDRTFLLDEKDQHPTWFGKATASAPKKMLDWQHFFDYIIGYWPDTTGITASTNGVCYYAWKDNSEFIFNDLATLSDIIHWNDYDLEKSPPWRPLKQKAVIGWDDGEEDDFEFGDWLFYSSFLVKLPQVPKLNPPKASNIKFLHNGKTEIYPNMLKNKNDRNSLVRSTFDERLVFPHNAKCKNHNDVVLQLHPHPLECDNAFNMAKMLLCSVDNLDVMTKIYPETVLVETGVRGPHKQNCDWVWEGEIQIDITKNNVANFIGSETCNLHSCTKRREIFEFPYIASLAMKGVKATS